MSERKGLAAVIAIAMIAAAALPAQWGAAAAALALLAIARLATTPLARSRRRSAALLAFGAGVELLAGAAVGVHALRAGSAEGRLRASYARYWDELAADADRAVEAVAPVAELEPVAGRQRELFRRLERVSRAGAGAADRTYLLLDAYGDLDAWRGPGMLQDATARDLDRGGVGVAHGERSVTVFVTRPVARGDGPAGRLLVGQSFTFDAGPPSRRVDRGHFRVGRWELAAGDAGQTPALDLFGPVIERPPLDVASLDRLGALAIALGFAVVAASAGARRLVTTVVQRRPVGLAPAAAMPFAAAAIALAAGGSIGGALAAAAGGGLAIAGLAAGRRRSGPIALLPATLVGPLLVGAFAFVSAAGPGLGDSLLGGGDTLALRIAATCGLFGAFAAGAAWRRWEQDEGRAARLAFGLAAIAAVTAAVVVDRTLLAALLIGAGGFAAALGFASRRATPGSSVVVGAALALLLAGTAASVGDWLATRRASADRVRALLPPSEAAIEALVAETDAAFGELAHRLPSAEEQAERGLPSDLAYAIWRDSPLARTDLFSALTVATPSGRPESFSYGLPIDGEGRIDLSAARWVDLAPPAWRELRRSEEVLVHGRAERPWRLRWAFVPRPGFDAASASPVAEMPRGAWRAGRALAPLPELRRHERAVIFAGAGRPLASSWLEGTPRWDDAWLEGRPFQRRALTPDGVARVTAGARDGITAALFLPIPTPAGALERAGTFAAGALLVLAGLAIPALALALPRRAVGAVVGRTLRSYSRRLVLVVSACLLVPLFVVYVFLAASLERRLAHEQQAAVLDALRSAQRVLGEYVLSLEPGFGVGTALDDRLLEWLARVVRNEIHLYWGSEVYASSKRDLFAAGLLPRRIPGDVWERLHLDGERLVRRTTRGGAEEYLEIYAPLEIPGLAADSTKLVLALPLLGRQEELAAEIAVARRRALLAALAVAALVLSAGWVAARRFTRPIEAIVAGTRRIAEGAEGLGFRPEETELEALAEAIDRMAARVADARRRLLVEKNLVERVVENVTAAVVGLDRDGRVLFANRLARSLVGAMPGAALAPALVAAGLDAAESVLERAAASGEPITARVTIDDSDREWTLVRVPLPGSGEPTDLIVIEDITDVLRAQRLEAWAAMARIIAHEIKNPLTPIRLSAEHLREAWSRDREHFAAVFERCTSNILAQVEELRRTASEFSLYSAIPVIEPQRADLRDAVAEIVEAYRGGPSAPVQVTLAAPDAEVAVSFDRRLLGRALRNLVENAVRASPAGSTVEVTIERLDGEATIRVADQGAGVPPEMLGRILEPYFSTQSGGTGLGLPIARRVAEEHGGGLSVRNRPSGGFEVAITIPLS